MIYFVKQLNLCIMKTAEYFIMRHSEYYNKDNQFVSYWGMISLKSSMDKLKEELSKKFPNRELVIIHSTLPRATHTSLLMEDILSNAFRISKRSDPRLVSDRYEINQKYIKEVVSECERKGEVCLILSHKPDIEHFCKKELEPSEYICLDIQIEEKEDDGLPF